MTPALVNELKQMHLPSESERPDLFGDFSRVPLGREQAQNTAQRGKAASNYMQDAYKAVMDAPQGFPGITGQQVPFEQQVKDLSKQLESQYKEKGNYITASGAIAKSPTPVEGMTGYQLGLKEHPRGFETMAKEIVEGMQDVMKGLPSRHAIEFIGGSHKGAAPRDSKGNIIPQQSISTPKAGTKEYAQRAAEGSLPGVGGLSPYQQETAKYQYGQMVAQEKAAAEEAEKKKTAQQQPQSASTPSVVDSTQFGQMSQDQYNRGSSFLQTLGISFPK